jgi:hypothetical protein
MYVAAFHLIFLKNLFQVTEYFALMIDTLKTQRTSMTVEATPNAKQENNNNYEQNLGQMRRQLEAERYAREQAEARNKQYEDEKRKKEAAQSEKEDSYDEPYIDQRRFKKEIESLKADLEETIDKRAEAKSRILLEQDKQAAFLRENRDFEKIMTPEMLQKFVDTYPDVAEGILSNMPDDFNRQKHVYKTIKSLKLHVKPEDKEKEDIQKTIEKNQKSGLYQPSGVAPSPFKSTGDFSKEGKKQAYDKMQELASRFGGKGVSIPGMGMR